MHLITLRQPTHLLKVYQLCQGGVREHVMASAHAFRESQRRQKRAKILKAYIGVGMSTEHLGEGFLTTRHGQMPNVAMAHAPSGIKATQLVRFQRVATVAGDG